MNELSPERCETLLNRGMVGHLAVVSDGDPYVSPISYVVLEGAICLRTGRGRRVDALKANPKVCIEVSEVDDNTGAWESVIAWGEAEFVEEDSRARDIIAAILEKYRSVLGSPLSPGTVFPEPGVVVRVPLESVSGRESGGFFSARTRPGRL
jgi:nitroimidazol reductase NimA-like FMN-containing flavoprotein (pyridoxamine 5'-phosphate oxidase superfamily)